MHSCASVCSHVYVLACVRPCFCVCVCICMCIYIYRYVNEFYIAHITVVGYCSVSSVLSVKILSAIVVPGIEGNIVDILTFIIHRILILHTVRYAV